MKCWMRNCWSAPSLPASHAHLQALIFGKCCSTLEGFSRRFHRRVEVFGMSLQKLLEIRTVSPVFSGILVFICHFLQAAAAVLITHFKVFPSVPCLCMKCDEIEVVYPRCVGCCLVQVIVRSKIKIQSSLTQYLLSKCPTEESRTTLEWLEGE